MKEKPETAYPNCLYSENGCAQTIKECRLCGFDRLEARRRARLPMTKGSDGLWRKRVGRNRNPY